MRPAMCTDRGIARSSLVENARTILSFIEAEEYRNDVNGVDCPLPGWLSHRRYDQDNGDMPQSVVICAACDNLIAFCSATERVCYPERLESSVFSELSLSSVLSKFLNYVSQYSDISARY